MPHIRLRLRTLMLAIVVAAILMGVARFAIQMQAFFGGTLVFEMFVFGFGTVFPPVVLIAAVIQLLVFWIYIWPKQRRAGEFSKTANLGGQERGDGASAG